jgi:hypothetical protein
VKTKNQVAALPANAIKHRERKIGMIEIMKYYTPQWLGIATILIAVASGFGYPMHGYIFSKALFVLFAP